MRLSRFFIFTAACFLAIAGMLAFNCSDDYRLVTPDRQWAWAPLGMGVDSLIYAFTIYNNKLIAGGIFDTAGGASVNHIAAWNSSVWESLGTGIIGNIYALTFYDNKLIYVK